MHPRFEERLADVMWECAPDDLHRVTLLHPPRARIGIHDPLRDSWWIHDYGDWTRVDALFVETSEPLGHIELENWDD